jgi:hypothetical protein
MIRARCRAGERALLGFKFLSRECPRCRHDLSIDEVVCPNCGDDGTFHFPVAHAFGVALFVAGAVTYHFYPDVGAALIRFAGYDATIPR